MAKKQLILITNDDGYQAGGINALAESVRGLGEVVVVAPDGPCSGMSNAITSIIPLRYYALTEEEDFKVYVCTGTPVDCVKIGIAEVLKGRKPDLVITGINHGSNAAVSVLYSGTMGAAIEGCLFGIPSIGFSLLNHAADADFSACHSITSLLSQKILEQGLPQGTCLNVNIPNSNKFKGIKICKQTAGQWVQEFAPSKDGANKDVFWLTGQFRNDEPNDKLTDEWALDNNYVAIVPVKVDMTNYEYMNSLKDFEKLI